MLINNQSKFYFIKLKFRFSRILKKFLPCNSYIYGDLLWWLFSFKKELIRKHCKRFYENNLNFLEKNKNHIERDYMERLWCCLFTKKFYQDQKKIFSSQKWRIFLN